METTCSGDEADADDRAAKWGNCVVLNCSRMCIHDIVMKTKNAIKSSQTHAREFKCIW